MRSRDVSHNIKWPMHTTIGRAQAISLNRMNFVRRLTSVTKRERVRKKVAQKNFSMQSSDVWSQHERMIKCENRIATRLQEHRRFM